MTHSDLSRDLIVGPSIYCDASLAYALSLHVLPASRLPQLVSRATAERQGSLAITFPLCLPPMQRQSMLTASFDIHVLLLALFVVRGIDALWGCWGIGDAKSNVFHCSAWESTDDI